MCHMPPRCLSVTQNTPCSPLGPADMEGTKELAHPSCPHVLVTQNGEIIPSCTGKGAVGITALIGEATAKADEASNNLLNVRKGESLENSRNKAGPNRRWEVKAVVWVSLNPPRAARSWWRAGTALHGTETFSAAPHEVPAALELHFPELPSAPPPEASYQKHGPLPAAAGAGNPSAFAGVLRPSIKMDID